MILPIVTYGHPILKQKAETVKEGGGRPEKLVNDMLETMYAAGGAGLAAPQVNQSLRLFVTGPLGDDDPDGHVFVNPEIIQFSGLFQGMPEACLSIPGLQLSLLRQEHIRIRYQTLDFSWEEKSYSGRAARILQHEYDHLEGILITDRIIPERKRSIKSFLHKLAQGKAKVEVPYPTIQ